MDTVLRLGDFEFSNLEIPENLVLGGVQVLARHRFPGGAKHVQALGPDHAPITFGGTFLGAAALDRARALDFMRVQGAPLQLTAFEFTYTVVIERYQFVVERFYKVPYVITLEVISDDSQPVTTIEPSGFDTAIQGDCDALYGLGIQVGDGPLSGAIAVLDTSIKQVSSFARASTTVIQGVLGNVAAVTTRAALLTSSARNTLNSVTTLGGVLPGNPLATTVNRVASQLSAATNYPILQNINSLTTRLGRNVSMASLQGSMRTVEVAGGTLFDVAAREYGDATRWASIAQASGLTDPVVTGLKKLKVPTNAQNSGGVLLQ
jgi:hypothetical protein